MLYKLFKLVKEEESIIGYSYIIQGNFRMSGTIANRNGETYEYQYETFYIDEEGKISVYWDDWRDDIDDEIACGIYQFDSVNENINCLIDKVESKIAFQKKLKEAKSSPNPTDVEMKKSLKQAIKPIVMPFGKHKDVEVSKLPKNYIEWLMGGNGERMEKFPKELQDEIKKVHEVK